MAMYMYPNCGYGISSDNRRKAVMKKKSCNEGGEE